jgi:hypothetical protein
VTRWAFALTGAIIVLGCLAIWTARFFGRSGSRLSVLVSVLSGWVSAYVLWSFAGGLAARYGFLESYNGGFFSLFALVSGMWQYRAQVSHGRERGLTVFIAAQLVWLAIVLFQNGALRN